MENMEAPSLSSITGNELTNSEISLQSFENEQEGDKARGSTPNGFRVRKVYVAASSCLFLSLTLGLVTGYSAPATFDMQHSSNSIVKPTDSEVTWIGSVILLGIILGNIIAGPLTDKTGRKDALVFNVVPAAFGWLMISYAKSVPVIIIGRFICGFACGAIIVIVPTYCVEISTEEMRGFLGSGFQGFLVIGHFLSVTIGSYIPWNYLALNGAVFSIVGVICFTAMPESPRWLITKGKLQDAIVIMNKLHGDSIDAAKVCNDISKDIESQPKLSFRELLNPTIYKPAAIAIILFFFCQLSGANVVFTYSSEIFEASRDFIDPEKATMVLGIVQVIGTLVSNFIVDRVGRKILLILSGIFMALSMAAMGIYDYATSINSNIADDWIPVVSMAVLVIAYSIGYGPVTILLTAEMLPMKARSTMTGLVGLFNACFAFVTTKTFYDLQKVINSYGVYLFYSGFSIIGVFFTIFVVTETKGRKLEDIENIFRPRQESITVKA